jgi:hypothetical protein
MGNGNRHFWICPIYSLLIILPFGCSTKRGVDKLSTLMNILLGVPQRIVLGPLFFLLMINDLAFIIELMCKLFSDDTTLGDFDNDLDRLIKRFLKKLKAPLEWCYYNKLDINWSNHFLCLCLTEVLNCQRRLLSIQKIK